MLLEASLYSLEKCGGVGSGGGTRELPWTFREAGFLTPSFRRLLRGRLRLSCFRGASAKGVSSLRCYPSKTQAVQKSFRKSFRKRSDSAKASTSFRLHSGNYFSEVLAGQFLKFVLYGINFPLAPAF